MRTAKILICGQRRLRSDWAATQADLSLRRPHEESLGPKLPIERTANTDETDLSLRWAVQMGVMPQSIPYLANTMIRKEISILKTTSVTKTTFVSYALC